MRILKTAVVLGLVSMASFASADAQSPGRASFHLGGGLVLPMGDFGDGFNTGWQGMGGVSFGLGALPFALRVDGSYGQHTSDATGNFKVKLFGGLAGAQFNLGSGPSPIKPYILVQVGMTNSKVSCDGCDFSGETDFTFAGGGGVQFGLGSLNAFVEAKYLSIQADPSANMIPIIVGVRFGGGM